MLEFLEEYRRIILGFHVFGTILGFGGAIMTDILFFRFLQDFRISKKEQEVFQILSSVIWAGLILLVISGLGLYLPKMEILNQSSKFLLKVCVVGVILLNGIALNLRIAPKLIKISFREKHEHESGELRKMRRLAFAFGSISFTSWMCAFILGMSKSIPLPFEQLLGIYFLILAGAVMSSQILERHYDHKAKQN